MASSLKILKTLSHRAHKKIKTLGVEISKKIFLAKIIKKEKIF
jgi:antitoxin component of RelBE/YafQ-DinJ toxin-antitoxin module